MKRIYPPDFEPNTWREWFPDLLTVLGLLKSECNKEEAPLLRAAILKKIKSIRRQLDEADRLVP